MTEKTEHQKAAIELAKSDIPLWGLAHAFAASGYFDDVRKVSQALVKIAAGQELGFGPMASMTGIHLIENEIMLGANLCAAIVRRDADWDYQILELTEERCQVVFKRLVDGEWVDQHPVSDFTIEHAKQAGLLRARSGWDRNPRNMLFARAITNGIKWHAPHLTGGAPLYAEGDFLEAEFKVVGNGEAVEPEVEAEADVADVAKRLEHQWEEPVKDKLLELGLVKHPAHAVALLNRSPFGGVEFGKLAVAEAVAWSICWTLAKEELPESPKPTADQVQEIALRNWSDTPKREGYRTLAREQMGQ